MEEEDREKDQQQRQQQQQLQQQTQGDRRKTTRGTDVQPWGEDTREATQRRTDVTPLGGQTCNREGRHTRHHMGDRHETTRWQTCNHGGGHTRPAWRALRPPDSRTGAPCHSLSPLPLLPGAARAGAASPAASLAGP